jgi:hypothetical protein
MTTEKNVTNCFDLLHFMSQQPGMTTTLHFRDSFSHSLTVDVLLIATIVESSYFKFSSCELWSIVTDSYINFM